MSEIFKFLSEPVGHMSGMCQVYTWHIPLLENRPAVAMQLAGCSGLGTGIVSVILGV